MSVYSYLCYWNLETSLSTKHFFRYYQGSIEFDAILPKMDVVNLLYNLLTEVENCNWQTKKIRYYN